LQSLYAVLVPFVMSVTGLDAAHVVQGLPNRATMPTPGFVSMQALFRKRLRTNIHSQALAPNNATLEEGVELTVQMDCYGPQSTGSGDGAEDWATILSATLRDQYGCAALAPTMQPLYADEARLIPLIAGEEQYEERWSLDAHFQYNPVITIPQQSADVATIGLVDVDERYPPT
jgi:hypothetical protein